MDKNKKRHDYAKEALEFYRKHQSPAPLTIAESENWERNAEIIREQKK